MMRFLVPRSSNILESRVRTLMMIWPMLTRATVPLGLPQAPRIPVCSLSAPAQDNILLIRTTWNGWARTRRWKPSLPVCLTRYLLAQIRAASRASELSCSYSLETRWMHRGKSSTLARLRPRSKMRILGSGTPRLKRDLGNGYTENCVSKSASAHLHVPPAFANLAGDSG